MCFCLNYDICFSQCIRFLLEFCVPVDTKFSPLGGNQFRLSYRRLVEHFSISAIDALPCAAADVVAVAVAVADLHRRLPR